MQTMSKYVNGSLVSYVFYDFWYNNVDYKRGLCLSSFILGQDIHRYFYRVGLYVWGEKEG